MTPLTTGIEDGIAWAVCRAPLFGAANGYVLLPEGHPWRELDLQMSDCDKGPNVHGGITYGPTAEGWIGFDTLHGGDVWPGSPSGAESIHDKHWTVELVVAEAKSLARRAALVYGDRGPSVTPKDPS